MLAAPRREHCAGPVAGCFDRESVREDDAMARVNGKPAAPAVPVPHNPADYAAALAEIARLRAEVASASSGRSNRAPGFYPRAVPVPKNGGKPGRALADVVIPGGITLSLYVGGNGKCTFGGGFGSRGFGLWGAEIDAFLAYAESGALRADLNRPEIRGTMADRWTPGAE